MKLGTVLMLKCMLIEDVSHQESLVEAETITVVVRTLLQLSREWYSKKRKRTSTSDDEAALVPNKKRVKSDYEAAHQRVKRHYIGSSEYVPRFNDMQFERMFRVTRAIFQDLINKLCSYDSFFLRKCNAAKIPGIYPEVKILAALKTISYGITANCFTDYFEMGETVMRETVLHFARGVRNCYSDTYLRNMTKSDVERITSLHESIFGIQGFLGCLDCMHVYWKNCPLSWKGMFKGKEKKASIVLEAM